LRRGKCRAQTIDGVFPGIRQTQASDACTIAANDRVEAAAASELEQAPLAKEPRFVASVGKATALPLDGLSSLMAASPPAWTEAVVSPVSRLSGDAGVCSSARVST
jgi:hypothetical protein